MFWETCRLSTSGWFSWHFCFQNFLLRKGRGGKKKKECSSLVANLFQGQQTNFVRLYLHFESIAPVIRWRAELEEQAPSCQFLLLIWQRIFWAPSMSWRSAGHVYFPAPPFQQNGNCRNKCQEGCGRKGQGLCTVAFWWHGVSAPGWFPDWHLWAAAGWCDARAGLGEEIQAVLEADSTLVNLESRCNGFQPETREI